MAKIAKPLTNTEADRLKAKDKDIERYDGNGLILFVRVIGVKIWRFRYMRPFTKKKTKINLGYYPQTSISQARALANEYNALLARGIDPQHHRAKIEDEERMRNLNTFNAVALAWYEKKQSELKEKSTRKYWHEMNLYILPNLGRFPIADIAPTTCEPFLREIEARGKLNTLKSVCFLINDVLNFAVNGGLIPFNPCLKMSAIYKNPAKKHNPHISADELPELLGCINNSTLNAITKNALFFQALTMARPNEVTGAKWEEIDFTAKTWTIPAEKMKTGIKHIIPLSLQAVALLENLKGGRVMYEYIFPSPRKKGRALKQNALNDGLKRIGYKDSQTAHGLRGLARTWLADNGVQYEHAEACLSHKTGSTVSQAYNHTTYLEQRKAIMQKWGDFIAQCTNQSNG